VLNFGCLPVSEQQQAQSQYNVPPMGFGDDIPFQNIYRHHYVYLLLLEIAPSGAFL
jgi:hypothetical protein